MANHYNRAVGAITPDAIIQTTNTIEPITFNRSVSRIWRNNLISMAAGFGVGSTIFFGMGTLKALVMGDMFTYIAIFSPVEIMLSLAFTGAAYVAMFVKCLQDDSVLVETTSPVMIEQAVSGATSTLTRQDAIQIGNKHRLDYVAKNALVRGKKRSDVIFFNRLTETKIREAAAVILHAQDLYAGQYVVDPTGEGSNWAAFKAPFKEMGLISGKAGQRDAAQPGFFDVLLKIQTGQMLIQGAT